jgi:hypothetical protein
VKVAIGPRYSTGSANASRSSSSVALSDADLHTTLVDAFDALREFAVVLVFEADTDAPLNEKDYAKDFARLGGHDSEHTVRAACHDLQIYANGKEAEAVVACPR